MFLAVPTNDMTYIKKLIKQIVCNHLVATGPLVALIHVHITEVHVQITEVHVQITELYDQITELHVQIIDIHVQITEVHIQISCCCQ